MDFVSNRIADCAYDIADNLGYSEDKYIAIETILHQYFGTALQEHSLYIDSLTGEYEYDEEEDYA